MPYDIFSLYRKFLELYLRNKSIDYEVVHPWRKNWQFIVLHSLRVEEYAMQIIKVDFSNLSFNKIRNIKIASIFHDIGRIHNKENHASIGKGIIKEWFESNTNDLEKDDINEILFLIENHSNKENKTNNLSLSILQDADILDEIGVMSLFMASNWIDKEDPFFFNLLSRRFEQKEIDFCEKGFSLLKTKEAKKILNEKKEFILLLNEQIKKEIKGTEILFYEEMGKI
jgi:HD superfamily phosphodiesterase